MMAKAKSIVKPVELPWRFWVVLGAVSLVFVTLAVRAAYIQVIAPDLLVEEGDSRTLRTRNTPSYRGLITDRNGVELAVSVPVRAVWADPKIIHEQGALHHHRRWLALADVLGRETSELLERVQDPTRRFVYLQRQVSPTMADYVAQLDIPGIYLRKESRRYYPTGEVSAPLIGITDVDDNGIEGLERLYNEWLTGKPGVRKIRRDGKGRQVEILEMREGEKAGVLSLTIDQRIQAITYKAVKEATVYYQAMSVSAIVVDVESGDILAMANSPSFNPNDRSDAAAYKMRNRVITDAFEPGSSMKPLAILAALEFGKVSPTDSVDTSPGRMRLGGSLVKDPRNYGVLTLEQIIEKSSNMGTSKLVLDVPKQFLLDTYYNMGLMDDTGTHLAGESSGIFRERSRWSDFEIATLSFGYGISVTTAQIARMYTTLASGGIKKPLNIVKSTQRDAFAQQPERVISEENAKAVVAMMESVTQEGASARAASIPGYRVAGKTGTSRKAIAGGYGEEYVNIFAGIAPATNPKLVTVVLINEPGGDLYHASETAAPVFANIMSEALQLLNITPDGRRVSSTYAKRGGNNGN
jgi:cell division protein FtsI (penicillin-binding protein 3)